MAATPFEDRHGRKQVARAAPVSATARVPGSKSLTNRWLLLAGLADGETTLLNALESDDTVYMRRALAQLGVPITTTDPYWRVRGRSPWQAPRQPLFVGNAGTAMRFLAPALALMDSATEITGNARMLARPIADLVAGLRALGATVHYGGEKGYPPLRIEAPMRSGSVSIKGNSSSQYLSGLLMALPLLPGDSTITIDGPLVSRTYVAMTLAGMRTMGVEVEPDADFRVFHVPGGQRYVGRHITVEPDASTASYWFALPLMVGGEITLDGVPEHSHQGDFGLLQHLAEMGASVVRTDGSVRIGGSRLTGIDVDMNTRSDVAPTLAVIATRAETPTTIRGVGNMRIKECDRIETLQRAFDALGLRMESGDDWMKIFPGAPTRSACLDPEEDHRMAMVFALLGLAYGGVEIQDPDCVAKTYPGFYEDFGAVLQAR
jgi:3-phosphoshikimate 1-carboxyvinyltransferase